MKHCINATLLAFLICTGCHTYYKAQTVTPTASNHTEKKIDSLKLVNRYFVLREGSNAYYMNHLQFNADHTVITCTLDSLAPEHKLHLVNGVNHTQRYKRYDPNQLGVLNEVHLYIQPDTTAHLGAYSLNLSQVQKIEVIQKDQKRTTNSYVLGTLGFTLGTVALVAAIIAATKSSCPFVSAYDGNRFTLQGEIFGGAVYPQLARHDYLPLKMAPTANGTLQVKISNELQERQYTDVANLLVVTHNKNTRILSDEAGHLYNIGKPELPITASLNNKPINITPLQQHNDQVLQFMDDTTYANGHNEVMLQFKKPAGAAQAKLVLSLKNSYWLDYLYGELAKGFGKYYSLYIKKQHKKTPAELLRWVKEQQIPLEVSVKTGSGWAPVSRLTTIGPVATREIVVPIPATTDETITVKLSSGFMFWEIDYAGLDCTVDEAFTYKEYAPIDALDELNNNVLPQLQQEDGKYCEQPVPGNIATLSYKYTPVTDTSHTQSFILHTKGYYTHVRHFKGGMNKTFLQQFKQPNAFTAFSLQRFKQLNNAPLQTLSKN